MPSGFTHAFRTHTSSHACLSGSGLFTLGMTGGEGISSLGKENIVDMPRGHGSVADVVVNGYYAGGREGGGVHVLYGGSPLCFVLYTSTQTLHRPGPCVKCSLVELQERTVT